MKIEMVKHPGGILCPANDMELEKLNKFKTGEHYPVKIELVRNPKFHRKVFQFFRFCFEHWKGDNEFQSESQQFDVFRSHLTVLAGFYVKHFNIDGELRIEAESLSFGSMTEERFQEVYKALIQAAMKKIFKGADENTYNHLVSFF